MSGRTGRGAATRSATTRGADAPRAPRSGPRAATEDRADAGGTESPSGGSCADLRPDDLRPDDLMPDSVEPGGLEEDGPEPGGPKADGPESDGVEEALALVNHASHDTAPAPGRSSDPGARRLTPDGGSPAPDRPAAPGRQRSADPGDRAVEHRPSSWPEARRIAARAGREAPARTLRVPLEEALGRVLGEPLAALCDLPSFDTAAMDGWAVAGPGPWSVHDAGSVLAGRGAAEPLEDGTAVRIATGARIPPEATAVIRSEHARTDPGERLLHAERIVSQGQDIRPRGQECRSGDRLLPAASVVTPAVLGLAAAAGYDELSIVPRPVVQVLVLGDELLTEGLPHEGLIRDALGPLLVPWLTALGAKTLAVRRLGDDSRALRRAVTGADADVVITTGGTAAGPVDHLHPVLRAVGAELLVDSVAVRPGHPMLLARLPESRKNGSRTRHLVGLPGNPLAAVAGLVTLAEPLLRGLMGLPAAPSRHAPVHDGAPGHPYDTRLVPVVHDDGRPAPLRYSGPAMLRGIAVADGLAVVPPGGVRPGDRLEVLDLPWRP